jgi:hypothetical protein
VLFVDLLRFVAAFQMLQGHTVSALLAPAYRVGNWYAVWSAARGLTSVAFLFTAGLTFHIANVRGATSVERDANALRARVLRALRLIALGYVLHLPVQVLWNSDPASVRSAMQRFVAVDVLQCIGVGMLALDALSAWLSPSRLAYACVGLGVMLLGLAPVAGSWTLTSLPRSLAAYLSSHDGSLFPLVPWSAHIFFGAACGASISREPSRATGRLTALCVGLFGSAWLLHFAPRAEATAEHVWRLGWVVLVSALLCWLSRDRVRLPRWLQILGGETLFLYVFHVLLVYGDGFGLAGRIGAKLDPAAAVGAALAVVLTSFAAALAYRRVRGALRAKLTPRALG